MARASVKIDTTCLNGQPLESLQKLIESRIQYLNDSTKDSIAACVITLLKSIRAVTKRAKGNKDKIELIQDSSLIPSFSTQGGNRFPVIRVAGTRARFYPADDERVRITDSMISKSARVYRWTHVYSGKEHKYVILANSQDEAKKIAKKAIKNRIAQYGGLAKFALGMLMHKACTIPNADKDISLLAVSTADKSTTITKSNNAGFNSGTYSMTIEDNLNYAIDALSNGRQSLASAAEKACNKIASILHQKTKNNFFTPDFSSPFPTDLRGK